MGLDSISYGAKEKNFFEGKNTEAFGLPEFEVTYGGNTYEVTNEKNMAKKNYARIIGKIDGYANYYYVDEVQTETYYDEGDPKQKEQISAKYLGVIGITSSGVTAFFEEGEKGGQEGWVQATGEMLTTLRGVYNSAFAAGKLSQLQGKVNELDVPSTMA